MDGCLFARLSSWLEWYNRGAMELAPRPLQLHEISRDDEISVYPSARGFLPKLLHRECIAKTR